MLCQMCLYFFKQIENRLKFHFKVMDEYLLNHTMLQMVFFLQR